MPFFQQRSAIVEAVQHDNSNKSYKEIKKLGADVTIELALFGDCLNFNTYGGTLRVNVGDWIIKDKFGNYILCDNDTFQKSYMLIVDR